MLTPYNRNKRLHQRAALDKYSNKMENQQKTTASAAAVNTALFYIEGLVDGSAPTKEAAVALLTQAIVSLSHAINYLQYE